MSKKPTDDLSEMSKAQAEMAAGFQQEILKACENAGHYWLDRAKSETDLWSKLTMKMASVRSAPEALAVYQDWMTERMQMLVEDGRHLSEELQKVIHRTTESHH